MAIVTTRRRDDEQWVFELRTVEDKPVALRVEKTNDDRIWQATASVGLFKNDIKRRDELLDAFQEKECTNSAESVRFAE